MAKVVWKSYFSQWVIPENICTIPWVASGNSAGDGGPLDWNSKGMGGSLGWAVWRGGGLGQFGISEGKGGGGGGE